MHKRDKNVYYFCTLIMVCAEILIESIFTGSIAECPPQAQHKKNEETPLHICLCRRCLPFIIIFCESVALSARSDSAS